MSRNVKPEPRAERRELLRLIREIQALKLELDALRRLGQLGPEAREKEHTLEQLRWRLAVVARRSADAGVGAAA
jgi:hypothetical protein